MKLKDVGLIVYRVFVGIGLIGINMNLTENPVAPLGLIIFVMISSVVSVGVKIE